MHEYKTRNDFIGVLQGLGDTDVRKLSKDLRTSVECMRIEQHLRSGHDPEPAYESRLRVWVRTFLDVESFVGVHGNVPRENNRKKQDGDEGRLAFWLRYQRRRAIAIDLCTYQRVSLESLSGFSWAPLEETWEAHFVEYEQFLERERRVPRYRSAEVDERRLAAWAAKQRHAFKRARLDEARVEKLNSLATRVLSTRKTPL